jgi:hypothetical protein
MRAPAWRFAGEGVLLTLFGALWFGSLGAGAWWLVFALVGAIAQWPFPGEPTRRRVARELGGRAQRVARIVVAGALLAWRLAAA